MPKRDAELLLEDIHSAIARVERYTSGMQREQFLADEKTVDAVARNLEIIGEACPTTSSVSIKTSRGIRLQAYGTGSCTTISDWTWRSSGKSCRPHCRT